MEFVSPQLPRELFGWHSPRLGLDMPIVRYGTWGRPLLLLPTAAADYLEYERFFVIKMLEPLIFEGRLQVFSVNSINRFAWMDESVHPRESARRTALYMGYLEQEVVPHVRRVLQSPDVRLAISGASFGAFFSANAFFRRPDLFGTLIAMSGFYELSDAYLHGFRDENVYFNNPLWYLRNADHDTLTQLRHSQIHILSGRGSYEAPWASERLSSLLSEKSVPHHLDLWGHDVNHDWPWWRKMLPHVLQDRLGW